MTKPKTWPKVKTGRKTKRERIQQDRRLENSFMLGDTQQQASFYAGCGCSYTSKKYQEFRIAKEKIYQEYIKRYPPNDPGTSSQMVKDYLIKHIGKSSYERFGGN